MVYFTYSWIFVILSSSIYISLYSILLLLSFSFTLLFMQACTLCDALTDFKNSLVQDSEEVYDLLC